MKSYERINAIESRHDWQLVFSVGRVFVESCAAWFVSDGKPGQCSGFAIERTRQEEMIRYRFIPLDPTAGFKAVCQLLVVIHSWLRL
ncbi:hypothetical protein [Marinobacter bryozoorum]|uniref:hypothetical protein n=1 Tax=Marinobacter bryozoorum TaxID=256324 RepID=UPI00200415C8|nr:hypothetical protein [Marinobacter bryozoorum]